MRTAIAFLACAIASCTDTVDVSGAWSYDWQVRDTGEPYDGWDGHFRGLLTLTNDVTGTIGYPDEDPATLFGDPTLREKWLWPVYGTVDGDTLHLHAPAPNTAWDDPWWFDLKVDGDQMSGPSYAGNRRVLQPWPFNAAR